MSGRKDGIGIGEYDNNTGEVGAQGTEALDKGRIAASKTPLHNREHGKDGVQKVTEKHNSKKEKSKNGTVQPSGKKSKVKEVAIATWKVSDPLGAHMLDVDPVFSPDEKYVPGLMEGYSCSNSRLP